MRNLPDSNFLLRGLRRRMFVDCGPRACQESGILDRLDDHRYDCRRAAAFVHRLTYPQGLSVQRFSDSGGQVAWFEGGYYQQELFERHSEMAKSALAKQKRVQVEDLVADSHG